MNTCEYLEKNKAPSRSEFYRTFQSSKGEGEGRGDEEVQVLSTGKVRPTRPSNVEDGYCFPEAQTTPDGDALRSKILAKSLWGTVGDQ
ncbi:Equilibrative Nucleoside Transporter 1 [Manis pentadactyla]|nr:Equilibrative Nucleoside Transporter 1 [Manis pentadactyla]